MRDKDYDRAMKMALRLLSVRGRSLKEVHTRLAGSGVENSILEKVIEKLLNLNYLDDTEFAGQWARHLAFNLLYGDRRITESLKEKGVPEELIKKAIIQAREELDEKEAIRRILNKKIKYLGSEKLDLKQKRRLSQMLSGRGFPTGLIYEALKNPQEEYE